MKIRLASPVTFDSIVDGPGLRAVLWTQGCTHNCYGCQNPQTHDFNGGFYDDIDNVIKKILSNKIQSGVTFSGGDPLLQSCECAEIAKELKKYNKNIWCYTGFIYEDLLDNKNAFEFFKYIDVLVDGKFIENLKSYELRFKGSSNQRIIDIQKSLKEKNTILWEETK